MPANPDTTRRPFALLATGLFSLASLTGVAACGDDDEGLIDDDVEGELDDVGDEVEDLVEDTGDAIEEETDELPDETDDTDGQSEPAAPLGRSSFPDLSAAIGGTMSPADR